MSPRPRATRHDATALVYLNAAAAIIDASLMSDPVSSTPRLRSLHYPAALDWIRVEDVLRLAARDGHSVSKRAVLNRWASKDEFIRDAIVHAWLYRDRPEDNPVNLVEAAKLIENSASLSAGITGMVDHFVSALLAHPRSFLLAHVAPILSPHTQLANDLIQGSAPAMEAWIRAYQALIDAMGLRLRPDWPVERLAMSILLVMDGTTVRSRLNPADTYPNRWTAGSVYAGTVLAIVAAAVDTDGDGLTLASWLDRHVCRGAT